MPDRKSRAMKLHKRPTHSWRSCRCQLTRIATCAALSALLSSCQMAGARARDAADIFSIGLACGLGVKAQVLPVASTVGLIFNGVAIKNGECDTFGPCGSTGNDVGLGIWGGTASGGAARGKHYDVTYVLVGIPDYGDAPPALRPYYTEIEIAAAAWLGVRAGFNPGELVDFLLGWFGVDIYGDDCGVVESNDKGETQDAKSKK